MKYAWDHSLYRDVEINRLTLVEECRQNDRSFGEKGGNKIGTEGGGEREREREGERGRRETGKKEDRGTDRQMNKKTKVRKKESNGREDQNKSRFT